MLQLALEARDRAEAARAVIDAEGLTAKQGGALQRSHPSIATETQSRELFANLWLRLKLDWSADQDFKNADLMRAKMYPNAKGL